jgi:hypothetical protein
MGELNVLSQTAVILVYPITICFGLALIFRLVQLLTSPNLKGVLIAISNLFLLGLPVSLLGYLIGFMAGNSRTGVIGSLLSAVLGAIADVNIFGVGPQKAKGELTGYSVCLLAVALFAGTFHGAIRREASREEHLINLSDEEFRIRTYRKNLQLPEDIPTWMITGQPE